MVSPLLTQRLCNTDSEATFALIVISEHILDAIILGEMSSPSQFIQLMYQLYTGLHMCGRVWAFVLAPRRAGGLGGQGLLVLQGLGYGCCQVLGGGFLRSATDRQALGCQSLLCGGAYSCKLTMGHMLIHHKYTSYQQTPVRTTVSCICVVCLLNGLKCKGQIVWAKTAQMQLQCSEVKMRGNRLGDINV